jgi:hypothetical protein
MQVAAVVETEIVVEFKELVALVVAVMLAVKMEQHSLAVVVAVKVQTQAMQVQVVQV